MKAGPAATYRAAGQEPERVTGMRKSGNKTPKGSRKKKAAVKDLRVKEAKAVKGGAADIFAKIGDIKGESIDYR